MSHKLCSPTEVVHHTLEAEGVPGGDQEVERCCYEPGDQQHLVLPAPAATPTQVTVIIIVTVLLVIVGVVVRLILMIHTIAWNIEF